MSLAGRVVAEPKRRKIQMIADLNDFYELSRISFRELKLISFLYRACAIFLSIPQEVFSVLLKLSSRYQVQQESYLGQNQ